MRAAIPAAGFARDQSDAVAVGTPPATVETKMQQYAVPILDSTTTRGTRLLVTGLTGDRWCGALVPWQWRQNIGGAALSRPSSGRVSTNVPVAVSRKNRSRQHLK